ncbi:hypothetical protein [Streptomyces sp. YIM 98790]|uniref:hypothetical protein n=1 Tax=Streptomyces sp. YIM 98790 TaxID=2689077 RepID=UPI001FB5D1E5|nr:hypothetical protein [Streptomyces sp. YIM 98790]
MPGRGAGLLARLHLVRGLPGPDRGAPPAEAHAERRRGRLRLCLPSGLPAPMGYDAVGVAAPLGPRIRRGLPRTGCVFADAERWWWIVPEQADIGIAWPDAADYAAGGVVTAPGAVRMRPRLTHWPSDDVPYTHPIMLYIVLCNVLGLRPEWEQAATAPAG